MNDAITWGEEDVRDCMRAFDPAAEAFDADGVDADDPGAGPAAGLWGRRGSVSVVVFWASGDKPGEANVYSGERGGHLERFADPVEAIQHALNLARS